MGQKPVTKRSGAPAIDLFANRIGHYGDDTQQTYQAGGPAHGNPGAAQAFRKTMTGQAPGSRDGENQRQQNAAHVPEPGKRIALMNVSPNRMSLILKHNSHGVPGFAEVLDWIDAHQRPSWTVFFAGISLATRTAGIKGRVLAEVALDGHHLFRFNGRRR